MNIRLDDFTVTDSGSGKKLHRTKGVHSSATLSGSGLVDGLKIIVLAPPSSLTPTYRWTGRTANSSPDGSGCSVDLIERRKNHPKGHNNRDENTTVSVTANDTTTMSNTITPTVPTGA
jgi:hypothetical protein